MKDDKFKMIMLKERASFIESAYENSIDNDFTESINTEPEFDAGNYMNKSLSKVYRQSDKDKLARHLNGLLDKSIENRNE